MIAILDPFSGIAGDMTLGALLDLGLDPAWLRALPATLGLEGVGVRIERVKRGEIASWKVDFDIPPQPHGRHLKHIKAIVDASPAPARVKAKAMRGVRGGRDHRSGDPRHDRSRRCTCTRSARSTRSSTSSVRSGASIFSASDEVYCGTIALGDGFVDAAHGRLAVPAPATLRLLEGQSVRAGPPESGELTTPTGAALVKVLSRGAPPETYRPMKSGYGAGTRDPSGRANVLRIILAERRK